MKIIDLTKPIFSGMEVYPGDPEVRVKVVHNYDKNNWLLRKITIGSHTGTHVDAFSHMDQDGTTLDNISLDHFFGKAQLVDSDSSLPKDTGIIFKEEVDIIILNKILEATPPFVGGMVSESLERSLLKHQIVTYTDLINLDKLPVNKEFMFFGFPLKIKDGDGSPVRAVAIIEE